MLLPEQPEVDTELLRLAAGDHGDSPRSLEPAAGTGVLDAALNELERRLIQDAMSAAGGNQSEAARQLGVSRVGLIKKLTRLGLR